MKKLGYERLEGIIDSVYGPATKEMNDEIEKFMLKYRLAKVTICWARSDVDKEWFPKK